MRGCVLDAGKRQVLLLFKKGASRAFTAPHARRPTLRLTIFPVDNKEIARILWETADLMEIAGDDSFRIRSYRNGSTAVEGFPERVADILRDPARKVTEIPGIGKGLAAVLAQILERQSCDRRDELLEKFPAACLEFLKIQGLGPKSIALIFQHYRCETIDQLEKLCKDEKLRELPRMGAKLEEKVLRSIADYRRRSGRYLLSYAEGVAAETFIDNVDRMAFDNWDEHDAAHEPPPMREMPYPRAKSARQVPPSVRRMLAARASALVGPRAA